MPEIQYLKAQLHNLKNAETAANYRRYLKSPYEFYGIRVPELRKIAKSCKTNLYDAMNLFDELWNSGNHEEMSLALFIMQNCKIFNDELWRFLTQDRILGKLKTWDHVDALGTGILGNILLSNNYLTTDIKKLAEDRNPWLRRLAIVSLLPLIKKHKLELLKLLAENLCHDNDVYVQKAAGWMLREAAKKDSVGIREFIMLHRDMKPVCLSYATEKMPEAKKAIKEKLKSEKEKGIVKPAQDNLLDKIKYFRN